MSNQINFVSGMLKNAGSLGYSGSAFEGSPADETRKSIGRGYDAAVQGVQNAGSAVARGVQNAGSAIGRGYDAAVQGVQNAGSTIAQGYDDARAATGRGVLNASDYAYRHTRGTAYDGSTLDRALNPPKPTAPATPATPQYREGAVGMPNGPRATEGAVGMPNGPRATEGAVGMPNGPTATPQYREGAVGMPNGPTATPTAPPSLSLSTGVEQGSPTMDFNSNPTPAAPAASSQPYGTDAMGQANPDTAKRFGQAVAPAAPTAPYTDPRENRANTTIPRPAAATPPAAARPPAGRYPNASSAAPNAQNDLFKKYHGTSYDPNSTEDKSKMQALQASKGNPAKMLQTANAFPLHKKASAYPGF